MGVRSLNMTVHDLCIVLGHFLEYTYLTSLYIALFGVLSSTRFKRCYALGQSGHVLDVREPG